jgi:hypothetical protein
MEFLVCIHNHGYLFITIGYLFFMYCMQVIELITGRRHLMAMLDPPPSSPTVSATIISPQPSPLPGLVGPYSSIISQSDPLWLQSMADESSDISSLDPPLVSLERPLDAGGLPLPRGILSSSSHATEDAQQHQSRPPSAHASRAPPSTQLPTAAGHEGQEGGDSNTSTGIVGGLSDSYMQSERPFLIASVTLMARLIALGFGANQEGQWAADQATIGEAREGNLYISIHDHEHSN